jgi:hypothetical protein
MPSYQQVRYDTIGYPIRQDFPRELTNSRSLRIHALHGFVLRQAGVLVGRSRDFGKKIKRFCKEIKRFAKEIKRFCKEIKRFFTGMGRCFVPEPMMGYSVPGGKLPTGSGA